MNILILTIGSRGDVQPYIALGMGLKAAGHTVTIATCARFRSFVEDHALNYGYINDDLLKIIDSAQGKALMEDTSNIFRIIAAMIKMWRQVAPINRAVINDSWAVAQAVNPDVVCFHPKALLGPAIAEKLAIPGILASPLPMLVPTGEVPCMGFPDLKLGRWYNRLGYHIVHSLIRIAAGKYVRAWRRQTNTPVKRRNIDFLTDAQGRNIPALHAYSKYVAAQPKDWPDSAIASGYWFLKAKSDWSPPAELVDFLKAGPPPIYIGFGSMSGRNPKRLTGMIVEALEQTGHRGILATGWGGLETDDLPDTILAIDQAPHDWLFKHIAAVVHHGGAGSTAAGLLAGKPTLICPFFADQPFWGKTICALGAGPAPIPQKKINTDNLSDAFNQLVHDSEMQKNADRIGQQLRSEDGIGNAVRFIEQQTEAYSAPN